jgi:hypothetical protein
MAFGFIVGMCSTLPIALVLHFVWRAFSHDDD